MSIDPDVHYTLEAEREIPDAAPRGVATDEATADLIVTESAAYGTDLKLSVAVAGAVANFSWTGGVVVGVPASAYYNMGDGTSELAEPADAAQSHTYERNGTYTVMVEIDRSLQSPPQPSLHREVTFQITGVV